MWCIWQHSEPRHVMLFCYQKSLLLHAIYQDINHTDFRVFLCIQIRAHCVYTEQDTAAEQKKVKGSRQQQCPHMQSKCACKATSMRGLAKDESLLAYLSVYSI